MAFLGTSNYLKCSVCSPNSVMTRLEKIHLFIVSLKFMPIHFQVKHYNSINTEFIYHISDPCTSCLFASKKSCVRVILGNELSAALLED